MDPKIYAIHKRLKEQAGQRFEPTSPRTHKGPNGITIPLIRPPENCENRKRHVVKYDHLPTSTSIRVLQDLDDDPVYDALSYTWSCPVTVYSDQSEVSSATAWAAPSFDIICDGEPFSVTANLYAAILSLRLRASKTGHRYCRTLAGMEGSNMTEIASPTLYIWIDQICINQSDVKERNSQVMLMGRIYKQSRLCLVWLGGDDQFSQTAIDTMTKLLNTEDEMFSKLAALNIFQAKNYRDLGMELIEPWEWIALYTFLSRSWFWRSWVVQEAALSRQLSFCCGITTFTLDHLSYLMDLLIEAKCLSSMTGLAQALQGHSNSFTEQARMMKAQDPGARLYQPNSDDLPNQSMLKHLSGMRTNVFGFHSSIHSPKTLWKSDKHGLSHVMGPFKSMRATDPRDKVYAFLGLAEELGQVGTLQPAYEKPIAEAFRDAMQFMLHSSNSLNDLALKEDPQRTKTPGLESWVPDFTSDGLVSPRVHPVLSLWSKREHSGTSHFKFRSDGVLEVRGLRIGTACAVHELTGLLGPGADNGPNSLMSLLQTLPEESSVWVPPLTPSLRSYLETNDLVPNEEIYGQVTIQNGGAVVIQSRLEVFWRTLLTSRLGKEFPPCKNTVDLLLRFWDRELHLRMLIAGLFSDPAASSKQKNGMFSQFGGDSPNWDMLKSSISAMYRAQKILKDQLSDDVQDDLFPEEMSAILPELDAAWREGRRSDEGMAMAQVAMKELSRPFSAEALEFQREVEINCSGKHLFTTQEGQLGVVPKSTRVVDEVWNLAGADAPFVLRPRGDGRYTLLGGAYVHGAMFTEWHEGDVDSIAKDIKTILIV
ncbi:uncharacterized protein NECHADRAFT_79858 [Fusarium vanettenii 77-13-4]|uniref:Heterokaryon incompatibility domain-containing protein n=1 Tax=Fusarium vanettenii (strain ATCC MYA-4622 / CBS 123669 / FGSC 9596 / NRRL 45880 / 77-13-4) TaxID=660122 RepID=C7Z0D9_FUSV7|nr:uncharacterized protein NECHADRAFT_79858 [Fusarium vanettenii 77-13-4]EEU42364.1 hypothetical protein NECHADRAFT_79858 [Fusarium vanettenii 77-13-4]